MSIPSGARRWWAHWWEGINHLFLLIYLCTSTHAQTSKFCILWEFEIIGRPHQIGCILFLGVFGRLWITSLRSTISQYMSLRMVRYTSLVCMYQGLCTFLTYTWRWEYRVISMTWKVYLMLISLPDYLYPYISINNGPLGYLECIINND